MAFIDWIPIASTVKHYLDEPKGLSVADYNCNMDTRACIGGDPPTIYAATLQCYKLIDAQLSKYISNFAGGFADAAIKETVGAIGGVGMAYGAKKAVSRLAGLSMPVVGAVLVVDGFVDAGIVIDKINSMRKAAERAKALCCRCVEAECSEAQINDEVITIEGTYIGGDRSLRLTKKDAQKAADTNYDCNGVCSNGSCLPKTEVVEWKQSGLVFIKTSLKYNVYCTCHSNSSS